MSAKSFQIEVQSDFLERQAKAKPVTALAEFIWNALDADANNVRVYIVYDALDSMAKIVIQDNGQGIPYEEAPDLFTKLGGSWKKRGGHTKAQGRMLHGYEGRGRFKAFALGRVVDWHVTYRNPDGNYQAYDISMLEDNIREVRITEEEAVSTNSSGVEVTISELHRHFYSLESGNVTQDLTEIFALYLKDYRDVTITYQSTQIDPASVIAATKAYNLSDLQDEDKCYPTRLEIIEWKAATKRALYLCNEQGFPFSHVSTHFHVGQFQFSAYLKSHFIGQLHEDNQLELAEMSPLLMNTVEEAQKAIKEYFRERAAESARTVVEEWKAKKLYPYEGEAQTQIEKAERQIFDIVALTVQEATPDFNEVPGPQLALHLHMLRYAIERSPTDLQKILSEVVRLPRRKQRELAQLLDETDLSGIISAAALIADRLKFLQGLNVILFDYEMKNRLKERSQLHKILEQNTWIFGEEYNLWASDRELTTVLKAHRDHLDPDLVIDEPVRIINKKRGIVDLMLSRAQRRHRYNDIEHLVVELKAPRVNITAEHLMQIEGYALAIEEDARFHRVEGLKWHFWIISDEYNAQVGARIKNGPDPLRRLIQKGDRVSIGVKTWGELLEENNARLQFIKEKLEHRADEGQALAHLEEKHREFLEGVIFEDETSSDDDLSAAAS